MAILYITNIQYPSNCGGGSHITNISKGIENEGEEVYLLTKNPSLPRNRITMVNGLRVMNVDWPNTIFKMPPGMSSAAVSYLLSLPSVIKAIYQLNSFIRKYGVRLIYERFTLPGGIGILAGRMFGIPVVLEINDPYELDNEGFVYGIAKKINKKVQFSFSKALIVVSPIMEKIIAEQTNTRIAIVPCGADTEMFKPMEKDKELVRDMGIAGKKIITYMGSFRVYHGLGDLLAAYSLIEKIIGNVALVIIGGLGDSDREEIKSIIGQIESKDNIYWVGELNNEDIPRYLSISDICVAPYNTKLDPVRKGAFKRYGLWGSPVKIFEYLAMGKVVVAPCIGHIPEYVEGAGFLYEEGDVLDLAAALEKGLSLSPKDRELMGMVGRQRITEQFDWRILSRKTYHIINENIING
jgi:glycosyltransferase involved in cell wall biosynthesis